MLKLLSAMNNNKIHSSCPMGWRLYQLPDSEAYGNAMMNWYYSTQVSNEA